MLDIKYVFMTAAVVTTIDWTGSSGTGVFGVKIYSSDNVLFAEVAPTAAGASGSISFDGFNPHRIVFETDSSDEFAAAITIRQDGAIANSMFTCIDCAPGSQSVAIDNIYLDNVADIGQSASACDTSCEFVRSGTTVTSFSWTLDSNNEAGTIADLGFSLLDDSGNVLHTQPQTSSIYPDGVKFIGIVDAISFDGGTDEFGAFVFITQNGVDVTEEFRCTDCTEVLEPDLSNIFLDDDTSSASTPVTRCDNACNFERFGKNVP